MLSKRLKTVADMVKPCGFIADIGTDHAYLPIYLIKNNIASFAVAADISKGSCEKARRNIIACGLEKYIEVRQGSGLEVIAPEEMPDTIIISGMGGMLAIEVLSSHRCGFSCERLVLQVQRDIYAVRKHLHGRGYKIESEAVVKEEGKIYMAMCAVKGSEPPYTEAEYHFGRYLLAEKNPLLKEYIAYENNKTERVLLSLRDKHSEEIDQRKAQLNKLSRIQREALKCL